eukprot:664016-Amphidinium_carterae.1
MGAIPLQVAHAVQARGLALNGFWIETMEVPGPASLEAWGQSYGVLKWALLMLQALTLGRWKRTNS